MKSQSQQPIRVGVLFSETGVTSVIESSQRQATLLATEEINQAGGVDGRPIELIAYDPQSRPSLYHALAEKMILEDRVRIIVGCYMSSSRKAVIPMVERWNALLLYPTLYEGFEYSRNVFYTGAAPNQNSVQLADFMLRRFGSRVFMVGSDYIYPYESNRIMSDLILERGGESDSVSDLLRVLPGSSYAAPQGTIRIDEHNHHTYLHPRIARVNASGQFDILEQVERAVRPDPYLVSHSLQDWSARSPLTGRA